jgi:hypothetical protein
MRGEDEEDMLLPLEPWLDGDPWGSLAAPASLTIDALLLLPATSLACLASGVPVPTAERWRGLRLDSKCTSLR